MENFTQKRNYRLTDDRGRTLASQCDADLGLQKLAITKWRFQSTSLDDRVKQRDFLRTLILNNKMFKQQESHLATECLKRTFYFQNWKLRSISTTECYS